MRVTISAALSGYLGLSDGVTRHSRVTRERLQPTSTPSETTPTMDIDDIALVQRLHHGPVQHGTHVRALPPRDRRQSPDSKPCAKGDDADVINALLVSRVRVERRGHSRVPKSMLRWIHRPCHASSDASSSASRSPHIMDSRSLPETASVAGSDASSRLKLQLPASCEPLQPGSAKKQLVWIVCLGAARLPDCQH